MYKQKHKQWKNFFCKVKLSEQLLFDIRFQKRTPYKKHKVNPQLQRPQEQPFAKYGAYCTITKLMIPIWVQP